MYVEFVSLFACNSDLTILLLCRRAFRFASCVYLSFLRSFFASQRVTICVSRQASASEIVAKIDPTSLPGKPSGKPKSSQNRRRDALGTPGDAQERSGSDFGPSRKRLGASPARPGSARRISKGVPGVQNRRSGAPGTAPGRPKSMPSRVRERKN